MTLKANETCSCQVKVSLLDPTCMCYMQAEPLDVCTYVGLQGLARPLYGLQSCQDMYYYTRPMSFLNLH